MKTSTPTRQRAKMTMPSLQALYCTVVVFKPVTDKEYFSTETIGINEHCVYKLFIISGIYWYLLSRRGRKYRHSMFCQQRWQKKILDFPGINVTSSWLSLYSTLCKLCARKVPKKLMRETTNYGLSKCSIQQANPGKVWSWWWVRVFDPRIIPGSCDLSWEPYKISKKLSPALAEAIEAYKNGKI